jgi:hypothetical protein
MLSWNNAGVLSIFLKYYKMEQVIKSGFLFNKSPNLNFKHVLASCALLET